MKKKSIKDKLVKNVKNSIKRTVINSIVSGAVDAIVKGLVGDKKKSKWIIKLPIITLNWSILIEDWVIMGSFLFWFV